MSNYIKKENVIIAVIVVIYWLLEHLRSSTEKIKENSQSKNTKLSNTNQEQKRYFTKKQAKLLIPKRERIYRNKNMNKKLLPY